MARDSASEAASVPGVSVIGVGCLAEAVDHLRGDVVIAPTDACPVSAASAAPSAAVDLALVRGQSEARRALEVAAAGGHNLLFVGPPGCGKTLLARTLPGLLPPMALEECLEVTQIHSASGRGAGVLLRRRPFRAPHASASDAALVGGGQPPVPGEVSLAHRGVLFLDETPEFRRSALEALRAPLEDREVFIARASRRVRFPSAVTLVCAMNPCPCGYATDPTRPCRCTPRAVAAYAQRLSGPLLDRIDLHVELAPVAPERLASPPDGEDTATVRARVVAARARQLARNDVAGRRVANADLTMASLERFAPLGPAERRHLTRLARSYGLTARSWGRVIRVARTLADLVGAEAIEGGHLSEAVTYRRLLVEHERRRGGPRPGRRRPGGSPAGGSASAG